MATYNKLTPELIEQAKTCATDEERMAFLEKHHIELSPVEMEAASGGDHTTGILTGDEMDDGIHCSGWSEGYHEWRYVGISKPGRFLGDLWPDYLHRCIHCKKYTWIGSKYPDYK